MEDPEIHPKMYMYQRIVKAKLFIDTHYCEKIDLKSISSNASFSKFHFLRLFKQVFGKSPHAYLTELRIKEAKKLLESNSSVTESCFGVGFESIPSFIRLFKREVGISPKQYVLDFRAIQKRRLNAPLSFIPNCFAQHNGWSK